MEQRVEIKGPDEVGDIAVAAQQMDALANGLVSAMDAVSAVVEENTAATEEMAANSSEVTQSIENIAGISEENSASAEEVAAAVEEANAQVEEIMASAQSLSEMAQTLQQLVAKFTLPEAQGDKETRGQGNKVGRPVRHRLCPTSHLTSRCTSCPMATVGKTSHASWGVAHSVKHET